MFSLQQNWRRRQNRFKGGRGRGKEEVAQIHMHINVRMIK
jgi:hypothetical protein